MGKFDNAYDPTKVYSDSEQSGSDDDDDDHTGNPEEPAKERGHPNNDPKSANPEEPAATGGYSDKHLNKYVNPHPTTYTKARIPTLDHSSLAKASIVVDTPDNNFDTLCTPCIASKQTRIVIHSKPMTEVNEKLEEVHIDLWGPHYPQSLLGNTYMGILIDVKTKKSWVLYLRSKNKFVNAFQKWLPMVKA